MYPALNWMHGNESFLLSWTWQNDFIECPHVKFAEVMSLASFGHLRERLASDVISFYFPRVKEFIFKGQTVIFP